MTQRGNVPPPIVPLTELDARELIAKPLLSACSEYGPTRVATAIGCDEKTVRNARDEKSTLRLDLAFNLLALDGSALDGVLSHFQRRSAPFGAVCDTDGASLSLAQLLAPVIEAERDGKTEGHELAPHEALVRHVNAITAHWLDLIAEYRASGVVSLPIRGKVA
jgi:hypothetical protein